MPTPFLHLHRILLNLVFVSLAASDGEPTAGGGTYDSSICRRSVACGDRVNISYPFYLSNATGVIDGYSGGNCGYPGMGIVCEGDDRAILQLDRHNYTVLDINYDNHTVTLADADVLGAGAGDCPRVRHNVTIPSPQNSWLSFPANVDDSISFFFDCNFAQPPDIIPINCSGLKGLPGAPSSFLVPQPDTPPGDWFKSCKEVYVAPVLRYWLFLATTPNYTNLGSSGVYGQVLKHGFQLRWDPTAGSCDECEQSKGRCSYGTNGGFLGCFCSDGRVRNPDCGRVNSRKKGIMIGISIVSGAIVLSLLLMCAFWRKKFHGILSWKEGSKSTPSIESFLQKHEAQHPKRYTYSEVKIMTKSFGHKIGQGGFGTVYQGKMPNGKQIAVKLLKYRKDDGQEFMNEVASISRTSHVNIVSLLGYCLQGSKRALIYEYMLNGSLEKFAVGRNSGGENLLSWEKLFDIAVGIARGLEYLHRGCNTRIVHFDIKPHNILLDQDFCPKISDFGLAKLCMQKESIISIDDARGTIGYIAPEVFSKQFGAASSKSDVYSYGMMVLEMVGARKNINAGADTSSRYFPEWIYEHMEEYCANACEISPDTGVLVRKMMIVGLWCIQLLPINRPSMTRVVEMLECCANDLQIPPRSLLG